ncbi:MAG: radical SAM protein [Clostridiales bacterium]|nr:radical SAM protein [Clostridiales bacterium]
MDDLQALTSATEPPLVRKLHTVGRALGTPVSGTFELTSGCNFNCRMCYIHDRAANARKKNELTADEWLSVGKQAADSGTVFVLLTGGEPLIRPDFGKIYTGLRQLGLMISVNTNGSLITGKTAELFENNPPMRLNVSLYGDDRDTYRRLCGADAFYAVLSNIARMRAAGVEVKLNISFTEINAARMEGLAELTQKLGLHCQTSFYMYPPVRTSSPEAAAFRLSPSDAGKYQVEWSVRRGKTDLLKSSAGLLELMSARECEDADAPREGVRCRAGHTAYWIDSAGEMLMCGMIPVPAGNVRESGFNACWQKTRDFMKTVVMPAKCATCSYRPVCCVCPAACYAETGDFTKVPQYLCEMSRSIADGIRSKVKDEAE